MRILTIQVTFRCFTQKGFRGTIYATNATRDLCEIMLKDSAHIQMFEAEWRNRKGRRSGKEEFVPAYTFEDALGAIELIAGCNYQEIVNITDGVQGTLRGCGTSAGVFQH